MKKDQKKTLLYSAFPGTGKTHFFSHSSQYVLDSDSSKFNKSSFIPDYITHIKANIGKADVICISSHDDVRNALIDNDLDFILVYPDISLKEEYLRRYIGRGNMSGFIDLLNANWDNWLYQLKYQRGCTHFILQSGEYLSDIVGIVKDE